MVNLKQKSISQHQTNLLTYLHKNLNDINLIIQELITPLHLAAQNGHFEMYKYICDNTSLQGRQTKNMTIFLEHKCLSTIMTSETELIERTYIVTPTVTGVPAT